MELGPVSRKAELVSWPSQEHLEVTKVPFLFTPGDPLFCPHTWSPELFAVGCSPGATSTGDHHLAGRGLSPGSGVWLLLPPWLFQALFCSSLTVPQSVFGHRCPGRRDLPVSPAPFFHAGDWPGLTPGLSSVSLQGDSPGTAASPGRGHTSSSPGQLSGRSASIRRKLQTSGGCWGTVALLCILGIQLGSLHRRSLPPPDSAQPDAGRQSLHGGAS